MDARKEGMSERRPKSEGGRYFQPKGKSVYFNEVVRRYVCGQTQADIARTLGITAVTVNTIVKSCFGQAQIDNMHAASDYDAVQVAKQIQEIVPKAVQLIEETITDEQANRAVRLRAAQDLLDRAGHGAVKKVDMRTTNLTLNSNQLEEIKARAMQIASNIVDVEKVSA